MNLNDKQTLQNLKEAYYSDEGRLLVDYIIQEIKDNFDYDIIEIDGDNAQVGQEFKLFKKINSFLNELFEPLKN